MSKVSAEIIEKILNLRAKAENEASSEAEVIAAASMISRLMAKHDIVEADLVVNKSLEASEGRHNAGRKTRHWAARKAAHGIAEFTQTQHYYSTGRGNEIFVGLELDVQYALYLIELVQYSAERSWKRYKRMSVIPEKKRPAAKKSYLVSYGERISDRLVEMALERKRSQAVSTGTSLVVKKDELIETYVDQVWGGTKEARAERILDIDLAAAIAGMRDGDKLSLNRPLEADDDEDLLDKGA